MNIKKLVLFLSALFSLLTFASCKSKKSAEKSEKINVICSIFPEYDWARQIAADSQNVQVSLLIKSGVDLHSYRPTAKDIIQITNCDLFVYVGGESDAWIEDVLNKSTSKKIRTLNLLETLKNDVQEEELVEGMQAEEEGESCPEYDEHVWLSLRLAQKVCRAIAQEFSELDADEAELFAKNAESYIAQLSALDAEYAAAVRSANTKTVICTDRFPFRYLMDDYDLKCFAAFPGCSAETEASFETMAFLTQKVDETDANAVFVLENSSKKIAQTVIANSERKDQKILTLDSLQSASDQEIKSGKTYLSAMQKNLAALKEGLTSK